MARRRVEGAPVVVYGCSPMTASQDVPQAPPREDGEGDGRRASRDVPGLTACGLCSGETLGGRDPLVGGQRARLDRLAACGVARLTYVDCLDECERGDVVVARPSPGRRADGARPVWFERLAGEELTSELERWLADGGPGARPVPEALAALGIARTGEPEPEPDTHAHEHHADHEAVVSGSGVIDPVCGMTVDPATAAAAADHEGVTYSFCAMGCQKAFLGDPAQFV